MGRFFTRLCHGRGTAADPTKPVRAPFKPDYLPCFGGSAGFGALAGAGCAFAALRNISASAALISSGVAGGLLLVMATFL